MGVQRHLCRLRLNRWGEAKRNATNTFRIDCWPSSSHAGVDEVHLCFIFWKMKFAHSLFHLESTDKRKLNKTRLYQSNRRPTGTYWLSPTQPIVYRFYGITSRWMIAVTMVLQWWVYRRAHVLLLILLILPRRHLEKRRARVVFMMTLRTRRWKTMFPSTVGCSYCCCIRVDG